MSRRRVRLVDIDRLIDERFMPKRCQRRGRTICQCGHGSPVHAGAGVYGWFDGIGRGACTYGTCTCRRFKPYDYSKERERLRDKLRAFAFDVLRLDTKEE